MSDVLLGMVPPDSAERDAVHVAVIPMIAAHRLHAGQRVGILAPGVAGQSDSLVGTVGIVDPYRTDLIEQGTRFWLCLMPGTVTGMRHHWAHPAFDAQASAPQANPDKAESEAWLRAYATRCNPWEHADKAFYRLCNDLKKGGILFYGNDLHSLGELPDADELKRHAEAYLGITIDWDDYTFNCSC